MKVAIEEVTSTQMTLSEAAKQCAWRNFAASCDC